MGGPQRPPGNPYIHKVRKQTAFQGNSPSHSPGPRNGTQIGGRKHLAGGLQVVFLDYSVARMGTSRLLSGLHSLSLGTERWDVCVGVWVCEQVSTRGCRLGLELV